MSESTSRNAFGALRHALLGACAAGAAWLAADARAVEREEFAAGWPLELPAEQGFFDLPLTLEIYQAARRLDEVAILDATGEPMPFYRVIAPSPAPIERRIELRASPLYESDASGAGGVSVTTDGDRTDVTVAPRDEESADVVAFVLDARHVATTPFALDLQWRPLSEPFLMEVRIEQSLTLTDWRPVGRASVASLTIGDAPVRHGRVPVSAMAGGYYRITPRLNVAGWYLESAALIGAEPGAPAPAPPIARFQPLSATAANEAGADDRTLYFDMGAELPVSTVTIDFTVTNRWVEAGLASSNSLDGPWRIRAGTRLFYELDYEGEELLSPPINLGRVEDRYWRAVVDNVPAPRAVELQVTYPHDRLRFAATGTAPYMLVAGTVSSAAGPDATLAAVWADLRRDGKLETAVLGPRVVLGGTAALEAPRAFPWRTALLWAVLVIGVLAVAGMAVRLARETSKTR